ncbi:uncharacterized protein LOC121416815 [Lytechinus variegatus]|uniref:uncharacterized protein LOC121416815 n=1 Tax=Lytechinus variegatus TaxID=7654 RepID=UPI001BB291FA|nr:uncharacterized protein LOC121416815 [Lytechinus variegatus]
MEIISSNPNLTLMVLNEHEEWESAVPATPTVSPSSSISSASSSSSSFQLRVDAISPSESESSDSTTPRRHFHLSGVQDACTRSENLKDVLLTRGGECILEEYDHSKCLTDRTRRLLVNITVAYMMEKYGNTPKAAIKKKYAVALVSLFPSLKDPHTASGHEAFYDERSNTGFLVARIKNVNRMQNKNATQRNRKILPTLPTAGPKNNQRNLKLEEEVSREQQESEMNWLKHTPNVATDRSVIMRKMRNTFKLRHEMVRDGREAGNIIQEFRPFLTTAGLIEQDFSLMFPENHSHFLEKWPRMKVKVLSLAKELHGNPTAENLLKHVAREKDSDALSQGWNGDTAAVLLLLCLLPPCNHGRSGAVGKMSVGSAVDLLLQFEKTGVNLEQLLQEGKRQMQPFLLALGRSKAQITQYFIIIDHMALPCAAHDIEGAMDALFKSHYVFGLEYARPLKNFWTFVQTTIYGVDVDITLEPPKVRELRAKLL